MQQDPSIQFAPPGESADALIALAQARGYTVTKRQLAEWHRGGLLPTPEQTFGNKPGSISVYPSGTGERLLLLCACRMQHPHNLGEVAWCMWWQGAEAPMSLVRTLLTRVVEEWRDVTSLLSRKAPTPGGGPATGGLSREAKKLINQVETARTTKTDMRQARKRTGQSNFPTFARVLFEVMVGAFAGFDAANPKTAQEDQAIVEKGLGFVRARKDRLPGTDPWLGDDVSEGLREVGGVVERFPLGFDLPTTGDNELDRTREEVRTFLGFMDSFSAYLERSFGSGAFGLTAFGSVIRRLKPRDQGFVLLFWRSCRAAGFGERLDQALITARQWNSVHVPLIKALEDLSAEVPPTADLLTPKRMGKAVRRKTAMEQTLEAIRAVRATHSAELDAFFVRHPEVQQAIDAFESTQSSEDEKNRQAGDAGE